MADQIKRIFWVSDTYLWMWLVTPHFCHCTCTVLLLMTNLYLILCILFWEVLVQSKSLFAIKYFYLFTFFITLCKTCAISSTWVSHLHFNLYLIWPKLLNSVILVRMIIFLSAIASFICSHHLLFKIFLSICVSVYISTKYVYLIHFFIT